MNRSTLFAVLLVVLGIVGSGLLFAQDSTKAAPPPPAVTYEDGSLHLTKDAYLRIGALFQPALELQQDLPTAVDNASGTYNARWQKQLFIRRMRLLFNGKFSQEFAFFFDFEVPNAGRITSGAKANSVAANLLDAQMSWIASQQFSLLAGLMLVGPTRNGLQGATSLMPVNYGAYTFTANSGSPNGLDNGVGRDVAVMARGLFDENRLEYRLSLSDGRSRAATQALYSPFRVTARLQYDIWDKQTADLFSGIGSFFYSGTYFGKKNVLAVGGGLDMQGNYLSYAADLFLDHPMGEGDGLTVSLGFQGLNGGSPDGSDLLRRASTGLVDSVRADAVSRLVPKQTVLFAEAGYYIKSLNLQPILKYETRSVSATDPQVLNLPMSAPDALVTQTKNVLSESRFGVGLNFVPKGHNVNLKAIFEIVSKTQKGIPATGDPYPEFAKSYSIFTLQGQWMFF
jgi:hypothetical protein